MNAASKRNRLLLFSAMAVGAAVAGVFLFSFQRAAAPASLPDTNMTITSPLFLHNGSIPKKFTCEGNNSNPELRFGGVPEQAKSLALIMDDPDAPMGTFTHWLLWNIAPNVSVIAEESVPAGALQGKNGAGKNSYIGPCPPPGKPHRYFFKLYALDSFLDLSAGSDKNSLESEINVHRLGKAELIGIYQR